MRHRLYHPSSDVRDVPGVLADMLTGRIAGWHLRFPIPCALPSDIFKGGFVLHGNLMHEAQHGSSVPVFP
ncbi:hypothetical protein E4K72_13265 [Oxalobacteraceae bacterium OM1]|nr:hypothetical protein E4K72_13265 [Oxalobacteraceae bacterium OM1]